LVAPGALKSNTSSDATQNGWMSSFAVRFHREVRRPPGRGQIATKAANSKTVLHRYLTDVDR
jgi:hypothetical protein